MAKHAGIEVINSENKVIEALEVNFNLVVEIFFKVDLSKNGGCDNQLLDNVRTKVVLYTEDKHVGISKVPVEGTVVGNNLRRTEERSLDFVRTVVLGKVFRAVTNLADEVLSN